MKSPKKKLKKFNNGKGMAEVVHHLGKFQIIPYFLYKLPKFWQIWQICMLVIQTRQKGLESWEVVKLGTRAPPIHFPILSLRIDPCWHLTSKLSLYPHLDVNCPHIPSTVSASARTPINVIGPSYQFGLNRNARALKAEIDLCTIQPAAPAANDPPSLYDLVLVRLGHSELQSVR